MYRDRCFELDFSVICFVASGRHCDGIDIAALSLVELLPIVVAASVVATFAVEEQFASPRLVVAHRQDEVLSRNGQGEKEYGIE